MVFRLLRLRRRLLLRQRRLLRLRRQRPPLRLRMQRMVASYLVIQLVRAPVHPRLK